MNLSDDGNDFDETSEYKFASEEQYLAQGKGCALNLQIEHRRATEGKELEEIDLNVIDALETRACMLNAIFCVHGNLCDDEEHPVCSITVPLKEQLTLLIHKLRGENEHEF